MIMIKLSYEEMERNFAALGTRELKSMPFSFSLFQKNLKKSNMSVFLQSFKFIVGSQCCIRMS